MKSDNLLIPSTYTAFKSLPGGKAFIQTEIDLPPLGPFDVAVATICCSVCFTDLLFASQAECCPGHEIIGQVQFCGLSVTSVSPGDIVGFGYLRSTCLDCHLCLSGSEILCPHRKTFSDGIGGFSNAAVWDSRFVYKIPKEIEPRHAAPLTCAGASVFGALYGNHVSPTATVGVVGLGGLGSLAIQFAKAWGCKVVALSSSPEKESNARLLGAHEFINTKELGTLETSTRCDYMIHTASGDLEWEHYINLMNENGTFILMGVSAKGSLEVPYFPLLFKQIKVVGSLVAPRHVVRKMLDFAARHNIKPEIEELDMGVKGIQEAFRRVSTGEVRHRVVLNVPEHLKL